MSLKYTSVNITTDKKKELFGLEGNNYIPILVSGVVSFLMLKIFWVDGLWMKIIVGMAPVFLTTAFVVCFINKRPPCYLQDFIAKYFFKLTAFNVVPRVRNPSMVNALKPSRDERMRSQNIRSIR